MAYKLLPEQEFKIKVNKAASAIEIMTGIHRNEFLSDSSHNKFTINAKRWFTFALSEILDVPRIQITNVGFKMHTIKDYIEIVNRSHDKTDIMKAKRLRELLSQIDA